MVTCVVLWYYQEGNDLLTYLDKNHEKSEYLLKFILLRQASSLGSKLYLGQIYLVQQPVSAVTSIRSQISCARNNLSKRIHLNDS